MNDLNEDPLDLLHDDGDGVIEMCLLFDKDKKNKQSGGKPPGNGGCCVVLLTMGSAVLLTGWGITKLIA